MLMRPARGFSLIELMITLTLIGIMAALAIPAFSTWTANARVRTVSETIQNAVRMAQTEAVRRNRQTVFGFTDATPAAGVTPVANGANWFIQTLPLVTGESAEFVQGGSFAKQSAMTISGATLICFNSTGRQVSNTSTGLGVDCTAPTSATTPTAIDVTHTLADRRLRVQVALGGQIRMCDPGKTLPVQPDGC